MKHAVYKNRQQGLTLLELMVVLAIIGILAMVGATQFQNYIARSRATVGLNLAAPYKLAVEERISAGNTTFTAAQLALPPFTPTVDVTSISVSDRTLTGGGIITITFGARLNGGTLTLQPQINPDSVRWVCTSGGNANSPAGTGTLEARFAPANCA